MISSIDVIIPAYNAAAYVADTIQSVLSQTVLPYRVIVVNDGSTDETADVVARFKTGEHAQRVQIVTQANAGLSAARNAGIRASQAELLAFVDADDLWAPTKLARQLECFSRGDADLGVVYCGYGLIDANGARIGETDFDLSHGVRGLVYEQLQHGNLVSGSGSAVIVRRDCFERVGGFDEELPTCEDWDMWLRIAKFYTFDYVDEGLVFIRRHGESMQADPRKMLNGQLLFLNKRFLNASILEEQVREFRVSLIRNRVEACSLPSSRTCEAALQRRVGRAAVAIERLKLFLHVQVIRITSPDLIGRLFRKMRHTGKRAS
jgi:glycosyltransferase involved in cell wall biosynthesis